MLGLSIQQALISFTDSPSFINGSDSFRGFFVTFWLFSRKRPLSNLILFSFFFFSDISTMDQRLENLRCDERDVLDKSGPKVARHKPISDLLTPTELKPYIPYRSSEDLVYKGTRKCCEFSDKGHIKNTY